MGNYWIFFSAFALITIVLATTIRAGEPQQPSQQGPARAGGRKVVGNLIVRRRALRSFEAWLESVDDEDKLETPVRSEAWEVEYRAKKGSSDGWQYAFVEECQETLKKGMQLRRTASFNGSIHLHGVATRDKTAIREFLFSGGYAGIDLRGLSARQLKFQSFVGTITLHDMFVDRLELQNTTAPVILVNTWIGDLSMQDTRLSLIDASGGGILNIECSTPSGQNPINGSAIFRPSVYFSREAGRRLAGPQPYRNMRAHMEKLQNGPAASMFFTLEQSVERNLHRKFSLDHVISLVYGAFSDYGSSARRPFWFFICLFVLTCVVVFFSDGANAPPMNELHGWQQELIGNDAWSRLLRAIVLTGQATLNPLGIFGIRGLLVAKSFLVELWLLVDGIVSILLFALFLLALRRRFKMPL